MTRTALHPNGRGWSDDTSAFAQESDNGDSIASMWRTGTDRRLWTVCAHERLYGVVRPTDLSVRCVMDDFGNLRRVQ